MAVTKNNSAIYLAVDELVSDPKLISSLKKIKYCQLDHSHSTTNMDCVDTNGSFRPEGAQVFHFTPERQITLDNTGEYAYILYSGGFSIDNILSCKIVGSNFENCLIERFFRNDMISAIGYRRSRSNDDSDSHQVTFHWKPHQVESR